MRTSSLRRTLLAGAHKFDVRIAQVLPKEMLTHFRTNPNFVTTLVCIGYGFGDLHINAVIADWLESSASRRLEIVNPQAKEITPFVAHVAPQVSIIQTVCTDYLDARAGIARSKIETLEKLIWHLSRRMERNRADAAICSFRAAEQQRMARALLARLESLPKKDGKPDFFAIGDPATLVREWMQDLELPKEGALGRLLAHLETLGIPEGHELIDS